MKNSFIQTTFLLTALVFCLAGTAVAEKTVVDPTGRSVRVPDRPSRIIALAANITEIVFALRQQHLLVGATQYSNYPAGAARLPKVGSYIRPDLERILSLRPDLCIGVKDGNPIAVVRRIMELGIPFYAVDPRNVSAVVETVQAIGDLLGAGENTARVVGGMNHKLDRIRRLVAGSRDRPRVFLQIGISPMVSVSPSTLVGELITLAGGRNVVEGSNRYPVFSMEQILSLAPDVYIITSMARENIFEDVKREWQQWQQMPAVRNKRIYLINSDLTDRPSPRLMEGLECLTAAIHPELIDMQQLNCR